MAPGPKAEKYEKYVAGNTSDNILSPSIVLLEVYRKLKKEKGEEKALEAYAHLQNTRVVPLDESMALSAADVGLKTGLGTVDSIVYATALRYKATLVTSDHHFKILPKVTIV